MRASFLLVRKILARIKVPLSSDVVTIVVVDDGVYYYVVRLIFGLIVNLSQQLLEALMEDITLRWTNHKHIISNLILKTP